MADRRTYVQTEGGEVEIQMEELKVGDVFRLAEPDGTPIEGTWRAVEEPQPCATPDGGTTWGVKVEPAEQAAQP